MVALFSLFSAPRSNAAGFIGAFEKAASWTSSVNSPWTSCRWTRSRTWSAKCVTPLPRANDTEKRVYEALSNKNWGASSTLLNDIARDTYDFEKYGIVLPLIWTSLQSPSREWRKVFKALCLLEHLIKNGAERVIEDARDNLHRVRMLSDFNYY
ncbi:conserved unknown protein [Ectocarpus siliculosus]|uniref:ENTH domain-containing protein n=1 Tax=Ectocarpus siliculosus TaxID=2880 RepID=D7G799_ECTSI|nr:conserved unknown protein [Ectocarpus siliculosus]|eukprot:CBJ27650.1 conserved unknown protein [Ectocarpus siliculosus]